MKRIMFLFLAASLVLFSCSQDQTIESDLSVDLKTEVGKQSEDLTFTNFSENKNFVVVEFSDNVDLSKYENTSSVTSTKIRSIDGITYYEQGGINYINVEDTSQYSSSRFGDCSDCPCGYSTITMICPGGWECTLCKCCPCEQNEQ